MPLFAKPQRPKTPPPPPPKPIPRKRFPWILLFLAASSIWFVWESVEPTLPKEGAPPKFYSSQHRQDLRATIVSAIRKSHKSVYMVMFGLTDKAVLTALSEKVAEEVPLTLYYDQSGSSNIKRILDGADVHPMQQSALMHQKILILDEKMIFLGSANMTPTSLKMHDNLVLGLVSQDMAEFLKKHRPFTPGYFATKVGKQPIELWLLPDIRGAALTSLRKELKRAKHSLKCALFTFSHPSLIDELIDAKKRGVKVTVLLDGMSSKGASKEALEKLTKAGVTVIASKGDPLLHHKFVLIDDTTLATGSANWTKAAFTKNSDCLLILHDLNGEQKAFLRDLWKRLEVKGRVG